MKKKHSHVRKKRTPATPEQLKKLSLRTLFEPSLSSYQSIQESLESIARACDNRPDLPQEFIDRLRSVAQFAEKAGRGVAEIIHALKSKP